MNTEGGRGGQRLEQGGSQLLAFNRIKKRVKALNWGDSMVSTLKDSLAAVGRVGLEGTQHECELGGVL